MPQAAPQTFGRYRVIQPLGAGGMAQVFMGYDPLLDREVAIKVVSHGQLDGAFNERFRREARAIATLRHPNIVQVYDYGEHESGHYMVMELVHGTDLGLHLLSLRSQHKLMGPLEIQSIVDQVAAGLDYAHARRVVHRDVKPSNILLGDDGTVVLTDFGLVLRFDPGVEPTRGQSFGTPEYIAPEQAVDGALATPRSDIYSLGVVLYLLLTDHLPFQADTPLKTALKHISDAPIRPREINPALSSAVEAVVLKALEKEPEKRYTSAGELARALRAAWSDELAAVAGVTQAALQSPTAGWLADHSAAAAPRSRRISPAGVVGGITLAAIIIGLVAAFAGRLAWRSSLLLPAATSSPTITTTFTPLLPTGTPTPEATATSIPTYTPSATSSPTHTPTETETPRPTATRTPFRLVPRATVTPTEPPWTGSLKLVAYDVGKKCVSTKPRVWTAWIKLDAQGGTGVYTYLIDDRIVVERVSSEYIYPLDVTDGSAFKAIRVSVESGGIRIKNPVDLWVVAPNGC